ncbi:MAG: DNA adenine methylase [Anaerolineae bacterium]
MGTPQPIPYQGSKRKLASCILSFCPDIPERLVEPFAGSAAVSIAAAMEGKAYRFHLNDVNKPLMGLWAEIINQPLRLADAYEKLWNQQIGNERQFYDEVRNRFNRTARPELLLYLLARCVKAAVRYNTDGEFNQSPDNRRKGRQPENMRQDIIAVSNLFRDRTRLSSVDYRSILRNVSRKDLVYLDPPYQGVSGRHHGRYSSGVASPELIRALSDLVKHRTSFILSYDGRTGKKVYGDGLPKKLGLYHIEVKAGRSAQSTLLDEREVTYESVYLSKPLLKQLRLPVDEIVGKLSSKYSVVVRC